MSLSVCQYEDKDLCIVCNQCVVSPRYCDIKITAMKLLYGDSYYVCIDVVSVAYEGDQCQSDAGGPVTT